jgi:hypothetical protein
VRLDRLAPDMLLLLDRSGSMANQEDDTRCPTGQPCMSKWSETTMAINQVVKETEGNLRWGLKYFANNSTCGVTPGVAVAVGLNNAMAISDSIMATQPAGSTPTRLAVASAADYLMSLTDPNPKFLLLATDGEPNCAPGQAADADDIAGAIAAVKMLADAGIPVYVIGIGNVATLVSNLSMLAMAGGRPQQGLTAYYPVASSGDLADALRAIGAQSMPCTYALPFLPADLAHVSIQVAGTSIPRDHNRAEGWDYDDSLKTIQLYGTWCAKDQAHMLAGIDFIAGCPP